ncbi:DUF742 domain-containing protein [Parasphingorhabdus pacifica]
MTVEDERPWTDEDAGPLVRPYAMTRGRTRAGEHQLDLITMVVSTRPVDPAVGLSADHERVVGLCKRPVSVAEVAGGLNVPLVVARVLLGDLMHEGAVIVRPPITPVAPTPDRTLLQAVLDGIRKL